MLGECELEARPEIPSRLRSVGVLTQPRTHFVSRVGRIVPYRDRRNGRDLSYDAQPQVAIDLEGSPVSDVGGKPGFHPVQAGSPREKENLG